jgi:putative phosphoribosyl transferase
MAGMGRARFADRADAGRQLAARLAPLRDTNPLILALPRGGVPVAHEIAQSIGADLDLLLVRKIGLPWQPELALAAVVDGAHPEIVVNEEILAEVSLPPNYLEVQIRKELNEIEARRIRYLGDRPPSPVDGRVVIVVDDGIATGATVRVALKALRRHQPARLIAATPVAPADTVERMRTEADEIVCLLTPEDFIAVGLHYVEFTQTSDAEVIGIMKLH